MVVLGGLEIAAVGYLLNEFNKDKMEERERRKQSNHRPEHEHRDRPHDDRPHSRPHSNSRPPPPQPYHPQASSTNLLAPPSAPSRPLSAPPQDPRPEWQRQQGYQQQGQNMAPQFQHQQPMSMSPNAPQHRPPQGPQQGPPGDAYAFQSQLWQKQQAQQAQQHRPSPPPNFAPGPNQAPNQPPTQNPLWQPGPQPGPQGPGQFHSQPPMNHPPQQYNNNPMNGPPGPGIQRPQTFQQGQQNPPNHPYIQPSNTFPQQPQFQQGPPPPQQPFLQHQNTFPIQNQNQGPPPPHRQQQQQPQFRPQTAPAPINQQPPAGPLVYINTKTGKVSHNLYPSDHPMHRPSMSTSNPNASNLSLARANTDLNDTEPLPKEFWGDEKYMRAMAGDIHTGMLWNEKDEDDLAYGEDYGYERERRKREKQRGRKESIVRELSYERVRTDRDRGSQWV